MKNLLMSCLLVLFCLLPGVSSDAKSFTSQGNESTLLELYTSQGCSSCPPAEVYFNNLKSHPHLFTKLFPIVFHVDYWDYIGWKDQLAHTNHAKRQRRLAHLQKRKTIYTPGVYRGAVKWEGWRKTPGKKIPFVNHGQKRLKATVKKGSVEIEFETQKRKLTYHLALLTFNAKAKIKSGERTGEQSIHHFAVIGHETVRSAESKVTLPMKKSVPSFTEHAIVVWVSEGEKEIPLQVTGGFLKDGFLASLN